MKEPQQIGPAIGYISNSDDSGMMCGIC